MRFLYRQRHQNIHKALEAALDRRMTTTQKQAAVQIINDIIAHPNDLPHPTGQQLLALAGTQTQEN